MSIFNPGTRWIREVLTLVIGALISHTVVGNVRKPVAQTKAPTTGEAISQQVRKLETGKTIERALRGGESHIYEIEIQAGQYLNAVVEQRGIDVVVRVIAPDGKHLMEIDSPNGDQGPEQVRMVAETSGNDRLIVQSLKNDAPVGKYEIRLMEVRAATQNDRALCEALKLNDAAMSLGQQGKYKEAIPLAQSALDILEKVLGPEHIDVAPSLDGLADLYHGSGDQAKGESLLRRALAIREKVLGPAHLDVTRSLNSLAALYITQLDFKKAEPLLERALAICERELGPDHLDVALSLTNMGLLQKALRDYVKAEPLFQRALAIRERTLGPEHCDVAASLTDLAELSEDKVDYAKAEPLYQRALAIREKLLGSRHADVATSLNNLGKLYYAKGEFIRAEPLFQRTLAIRETVLGPEHPDVADPLNNLGAIYKETGNYAKAETLYLRAMAISEKALGPEDPGVATPLHNLAVLYGDQGDYAKAEPLHLRALAIREKFFGPEHPKVALSLDSLAGFYAEKGEHAKAEPLYLRALAIKEKTLGTEHPDVSISLDNLGLLYEEEGRYAKAEPLLKRALAIKEKALGPEHVDVATTLNNLATYYFKRADYVKAEPLFQRSLIISEKVLGPDHPSIATTLNNLAGLYRAKGDYENAELLFSRMVSINMKALGPDHPLVASSLSNLSMLYLEGGDYEKAETLLLRAAKIRMKVLGKNHPDWATLLNNLAEVYEKKGDYKEAESWYLQAAKIALDSFGIEHPDVATIASNLARVYVEMGEPENAKFLCEHALATREKVLGQEDPHLADSLNDLALLYEAEGDMTKAVAFRVRAADISERNIALNLVAGSERQKLLYMRTFSDEENFALSLHIQGAPNNSQALRLALTTVLRRKGRVLDVMANSIADARRHSDPQLQALIDQLTVTYGRLASSQLAGPGKRDLKEYKAEIQLLERQVDDLEGKVSRQSREFRAQTQPVTLEAIQDAIPRDAMLVEFVTYTPYNTEKHQWAPQHYVAYVLGNAGKPAWVDLGATEEIDRAIKLLRAALRNHEGKPLSDKELDLKRKSRALDQKIMEPVRKLIGDKRKLLISPDGDLNLIPFAALVDEQGNYLVESYSLNYLTTGRDLLRLREKVASKEGSLIIANPDFGNAGKRDTSSPDNSGIFDGLYFPPLTAASEEGIEVQKILTDARTLTREGATEAALKSVTSPRILHIATHGFFLDDLTQVQTGDDKERTRIVRVKRAFRNAAHAGDPPIQINPLLRSGLALALANERKGKDGNDGILTALEASGLNLWGTKLVVLSACDTGLGEVRSGEGVYGLRRALVLAGSESQMMSLWPVSDTGTSELMIDYYKRLTAGEGRSEALRQAQLKMLRSLNRRHPFYWASFIQSGEWTNLDGKR